MRALIEHAVKPAKRVLAMAAESVSAWWRTAASESLPVPTAPSRSVVIGKAINRQLNRRRRPRDKYRRQPTSCIPTNALNLTHRLTGRFFRRQSPPPLRSTFLLRWRHPPASRWPAPSRYRQGVYREVKHRRMAGVNTVPQWSDQRGAKFCRNRYMTRTPG